MRISDHFALGEFTLSETAERFNINNEPNEEIIVRLKALSINVLEPIREQFGALHITSGYRCDELNMRIGGANSSQHIFGEAADIISYSYSPFEISNWICDNLTQYDQNIYEGRWTHISYSTRHLNRKVDLTAFFTNGSATYMSGINNRKQ